VLAADTSAEAEEVQVERWRTLSPTEKGRLVSQLSLAADRMALAGIAHRFPTATARERFLRLAQLRLGSDLARHAFPEIAALSDEP
jgi:hypothetical protein